MRKIKVEQAGGSRRGQTAILIRVFKVGLLKEVIFEQRQNEVTT